MQGRQQNGSNHSGNDLDWWVGAHHPRKHPNRRASRWKRGTVQLQLRERKMDRIIDFIATCIGSLLIGGVLVFGVAFFIMALLGDMCFTPEACAAAGNP
jgi:hypothetical protein